MKLKSIFLIVVALVVAASLPIVNFFHGDIAEANISTARAALDSAYKVNHVTGWMNLVRTRFGYSSAPTQVIMGKDGWMYLGDEYAKNMSVTRGMILPTDRSYEIAKKNRESIKDYAKEAGVQATYFMIAPNKESVYPENLPDWVAGNKKLNFSARLLEEKDNTLINLLPAMKLAREKYQQPIYLKTDSHWNAIGAWEAYKKLSEIMLRDMSDMKFISDADINTDLMHQGFGGDISTFLFLDKLISDSHPVIRSKSQPRISIVDVETRKTLYQGKNKAIASFNSPALVTSTAALNDTRVLWLRDSFGGALSPFMASTFRQTIQLHWKKVLSDPVKFKKLIDTFNPDIVLFTIVERDYFSVVNSSK